MNTFDGCCGSCVYLNTNDYVKHKDHCYCTYRKQYYNLTEKKCTYYRYDSRKDYYDLNRRWHIVSAMLTIMPDLINIPGMDALHKFRIDVLEKDEMYNNALCLYDIIGPFLAEELICDTKREEICFMLIENWLMDVIRLISTQQYIKAFEKYANMVNTLLDHYKKQFEKYMATKLVADVNLEVSI